MKTPRDCPVCLASSKHRVFRQQLSTLSEGSLMDGFDLVICDACGAAYADGIPAQEEFDRYYACMSKYEYSGRADAQSALDDQRFAEVAEMLVPHLRREDRLLDVGCAIGNLLGEFKQRGFVHLLGIDPSPACARLAEEINGVPARCATLATLADLGERADLVILTCVLEHLRDVEASLRQVKACLRDGGSLYIEVPDATRYDHHFSAPFQLISMEHINYFSPLSLGNLLARHGFSPVFSRRVIRHSTAQSIEPTVAALFRLNPPGTEAAPLVRDGETEPALERYLEQSRGVERRVQQKINALADAARPLAVWGVGTHTLRLLQTSRLPEARIVAFLDSNANYQGKQLAGVPVLAPADFTDPNVEVLISTQTAEDEIARTITQTLRWPNVVHQLYGA